MDALANVVMALAAIYGAVLSTWLWIERHLEQRPTFTLEPDDETRSTGGYRLALRITNPGRYPIMIRRIEAKEPGPEKTAISRAFADGMKLRHVIDYAITSDMNFSVPAEKNGKITFLVEDRDSSLDLEIIWYRQSPVPSREHRTRIKRSCAQLRQLVWASEPD